MDEDSSSAIENLMPKIIRSGAEVSEIKQILKRTRRAAKSLNWRFGVLLAGCFVGSCIIFSMLFTLISSYFFTQIMPLYHAILVLLPSALLSAALTHLSGNWFIYWLSGLTTTSRHCLALHLPWSRAPKEWPKFFRRWIYCGDWLIENFSGDLMPYVRAFVTGEKPRSINEELMIWNELMQRTNQRQNIEWEIGHSVRELAPVDNLPAWVREITPGMNLYEMERALGNVGHSWAVNLLKRAATRKKTFGSIDYDGDLHEAMFEFHYCQLSNNRDGLLVVIRPHHHHDLSSFGDSGVDAA